MLKYHENYSLETLIYLGLRPLVLEMLQGKVHDFPSQQLESARHEQVKQIPVCTFLSMGAFGSCAGSPGRVAAEALSQNLFGPGSASDALEETHMEPENHMVL